MYGGAFQTSRELFNNPIWNDVPKFRIFFYIYGNAVFSECGVNIGGIKLDRGQFLRSYRNLRDDLQFLENRSVKKYSLSLIKRKVDQLVKEDRLKIEETELGTLFTVVNYALYQGLSNYKNNNENAERTEGEHSENSNGTERERIENNNNNVNKDNKDKKDKKDNKNSCRKYIYDDTHYSLANQFYENILNNNPNHKKPNLEKWSNDIRLMIEQDNRTVEQISYLVDWVQKDDFEMNNVLSTDKLRKRFDQLAMKVKSSITKSKTIEQKKPKAYQSLEDWAGE